MTRLIRSTEEGPVEGRRDEETDALVWLGVPYARPPVGDLRWRAPAVPEKRCGVLEAKRSRAQALQCVAGRIVGSEDCLYLDIEAPGDLREGERLPVLVHVHGGNNQRGGSETGSDGRRLAAAERVIAVGVNHRLGVLGFLPIPVRKDASPEEKGGNFGLLDIRAALQWVRRNIASFGGDPGNVTLGGTSAGGRNALAALASPLFSGLFSKVLVLSSGILGCDRVMARRVHAKAFAEILPGIAAADIEAGDGAAMDRLLALPAEKLAALMPDAGIRMAKFPHLFEDGLTVAALPESSDVCEARLRGIPVLIASGSQEFNFYLPSDPLFAESVRTGEVFSDSVKRAQYSLASRIGGLLYERSNLQETADALVRAFGAKVFALRFCWGADPKIMGERAAFLHGSKHTIEHEFFFGDGRFDLVSLCPEAFALEGTKRLRAAMQRVLGNFLRSGDPGEAGGVRWEPWNPNTGACLEADAGREEPCFRMADRRLDPYLIAREFEEAGKGLPAKERSEVREALRGRFFSGTFDRRVP